MSTAGLPLTDPQRRGRAQAVTANADRSLGAADQGPANCEAISPHNALDTAGDAADFILLARPVTRAWCDGSGVLFSWEVAYPGGSASGITTTEHRAMTAVTTALREFGGCHGIVQEARLDMYRGNERDQYCYGRVVAYARVVGGVVEWVTP